MRKSTIYHILVVLLLSLLPLAGTAQQNTDVNKPTRSRVTEKDKKAKKSNQETKQVEAQNKKSDKATLKTEKEKVGEPAAKQGPEKPLNDTASKQVAQPKPKPKRVSVDPDKVDFDGIDVSKHQGNIDWAELKKNSKIQFVYVKATEGSNHTDWRYKQNFANARKHGFKVGSYHYFTDLSSAHTQFENFISVVNREEQDLLPVIDVERRSKWTAQQLRDSVKVFADLIEDYYGCKPMIYTFETFFNRNLGKAFENYPIFIAKYPKNQEQPNINGIKWVLWQFSESGKFHGVKDNLVDMSRFNRGCSMHDILYYPGKHKPKHSSVRDAVDHKEKPSTVNMTEHKVKETPRQSKRQQEEARKKAEKEKKAKERSQKLAQDEAKKKAEADKKAKKKAEQQKREKAREAEAKKKAEAEKKAVAEKKAKEKAEQQKREEARKAAAKKEADEKAKRKAAAKKAREEKAQQDAANKNKKTSSLLNATSSKMAQSQFNDSIRAAKQKGRKTNKSSADND